MAAKAGYQNVYVFRGGLPEWIKAGYPTKTTEALPKIDTQMLSVSALKEKLDKNEDFVLLDIRLELDAARFWIDVPQRQHISLNHITERYGEVPQEKTLVVIDKNGKRAGLAARYLSAKGHTDIAIVSGGMIQWIKAGLPTKMKK